MSEKIKYDPEDIESLLLNKEFDNLFPEEKKFVLKHLDDREEYNSMRKMILQFSYIDDSDNIDPNPKTLDLLMEKFVTEEKRGFKWWLNSLFTGFFPNEKSWFQRPGFQLAMVTCVFVLGFVFVQNNNILDNNSLAEAKIPTEKEISKIIENQKSKIEQEAITIDKNLEFENDENILQEETELEGGVESDNSNLSKNGSDNGLAISDDLANPIEETNTQSRLDNNSSTIVIATDNSIADTEQEESLEWSVIGDSKNFDNSSINENATDDADDFADDDGISNVSVANIELPESQNNVTSTDNVAVVQSTEKRISNSNLHYADDIQGNAPSEIQNLRTDGSVKIIALSQEKATSIDVDLIDMLYTAN